MSFDLSLSQVLMRVVAMLVITGIHGFALAGFARLLGDRGPGQDERLTLNPVSHLDLLGLVAAIMAMAGWIRPMRLEAGEMRGGRGGLALCVLASLLATATVCLLLLQLKPAAVLYTPYAASNQITAWLQILAEMSVVFAVVNLVPLPPLTGAHFLAALSPSLFERVKPASLILAIAFAILAVVDRGHILGPIVRPLLRNLTGS